VQKAINRIISQAEEHRNLTMKPQVLAPLGSLPTADHERSRGP
jgi:hypothetical protein